MKTEDHKLIVLMFLSCNFENCFSTLTDCMIVPWFILVLIEDFVLLVVMVLSRPPGLARCLGLDPWENHDLLGTWDDRYLKDTFNM